jgi:hypothetical protein
VVSDYKITWRSWPFFVVVVVVVMNSKTVISLDLRKPADFIYTGYTTQEKALNSLHIAYFGYSVEIVRCRFHH